MLRLAIAILLALCAASAQASPLRQYNVETPTSFAEVTADLERRLPDMVHRLGSRSATVAYSGKHPPMPLVRFLETTFEELAPGALVGKTLSLSLTVHGDTNRSILSLMLLGNFPSSDVNLPPKSLMMMDGGSRSACSGQVVARYPAEAAATAEVFREHMEEEGFSFPEADPQEVSFFIGHAPGCTLAMYLQPDQNTTMVVVRYLEE
jgi:hypothetical protein